MRQIVNGKLYDTEKSKLLCKQYCMIVGREDELYISDKGNLFVKRWDLFSEKYFMEPVEKEDVEEMLAAKNPDAYIELFGEVEEA